VGNVLICKIEEKLLIPFLERGSRPRRRKKNDESIIDVNFIRM